MCIRCGETEAPGPLGLCAACTVHTRIELAEGLRRLGAYLAAWASFADWLDARGPDRA